MPNSKSLKMRRAERPVPSVDVTKLRDVGWREFALRFAFGALVSVCAGIIGKQIGPRIGGVFLAFPAILPASLTLIQDKEGVAPADKDAIGAILGGFSLVVFAVIAESLLSRLTTPLVLFLALVGWLLVSTALYALLGFLRPDSISEEGD